MLRSLRGIEYRGEPAQVLFNALLKDAPIRIYNRIAVSDCLGGDRQRFLP